MQRDKLAKVILLAIFFPFVVYIFGSCVLGYIPPTESYKKTPKQFEALFNEQMAQYGMSMDLDGEGSARDNSGKRIVPIVCEDGSKISCSYSLYGGGSNARIIVLKFEQELSGKENETVYLEQLLAFVMDEFAPNMTQNKDETFEPYMSKSYNDALLVCGDFVKGDEEEIHIYVSPEDDAFFTVTFNRKTDEKTTLSVSLKLS